MDVGTVLAPAYDPLMRLCGWTRAQRSVLSASQGSVLDVGCGPARLADAVPGTYVGVDLRLEMLTRAHGPHLVCADAAALPFPNRTFDTVVSTAFLGLLSRTGGTRSCARWHASARTESGSWNLSVR